MKRILAGLTVSIVMASAADAGPLEDAGVISREAAVAAPPVNTIRELWPAILACWKPPAGSKGSEITLSFGLNHRGELRGPPMVTYSKLIGPPDIRKAFVLSALRAVAECTPLNLTDGFGRILAQRVIALRFMQTNCHAILANPSEHPGADVDMCKAKKP